MGCLTSASHLSHWGCLTPLRLVAQPRREGMSNVSDVLGTQSLHFILVQSSCFLDEGQALCGASLRTLYLAGWGNVMDDEDVKA